MSPSYESFRDRHQREHAEFDRKSNFWFALSAVLSVLFATALLALLIVGVAWLWGHM